MTYAKPSAVLFDFDGTVADTNELIYACLNYSVREHLGREYPRRLVEQNAGMPLAQLLQLICLGDESSRVEAMVHTYRRHQEGREHEISACAGIDVVLQKLRANDVRLAIVTTKLRAVATRQLRGIGLYENFETVVGFDDCRRAKPDPEPFEVALSRLGIPASAAIAIGDSAADIHGARAAGVRAIGATWGSFSPHWLTTARPDVILDSPGMLLELLEIQ